MRQRPTRVINMQICTILTCGCAWETRCPAAEAIREEFVGLKLYRPLIRSESQHARRRLVQAYTSHLRQAGLLDGYATDTEIWPRGKQE